MESNTNGERKQHIHPLAEASWGGSDLIQCTELSQQKSHKDIWFSVLFCLHYEN